MHSFLPHNFSFRSVSRTLSLLLNIKSLVFVMLRETLLAFSHFERNLRSLFTYLLISFIVFLMFNREVASAN